MAEPKLTRTQRDQWAEELESGRWTQDRGALHYNGSFCCLGVLARALLKISVRKLDGSSHLPIYEKIDSLLGNEVRRSLVTLNDEDGLTFPEIAKHVRALPVSEEEV